MGCFLSKDATQTQKQTQRQNRNEKHQENPRQKSDGEYALQQQTRKPQAQTQNMSNGEDTHHQTNAIQNAGNGNGSQHQRALEGQVTPEHDKRYKALKDCIQGIDKSFIGPELIKDAETLLAKLKKKFGIKDSSQSEKENTSNDPEEDIQKLKGQLREAQEQRGQLLNQISEVAGIRLKNNNPGIADLSDDNRPAKIAEKFSELYDNEWTNVIECLKDIGVDDEEKMIEFLFDIVKSSYTWCRDKAKEQVKEFIDKLLFSKADDTGGNKESIYENVQQDVSHNLNPEVQKRCQEIIRKNTSSNRIKEYEKEYKTKILYEKGSKYTDIHSKQPFQDYVSRCVYLSWYMSTQDPPVEMDLQEVNRLNIAQYRAYTKSGKFIDFVVWPALLLHSGGPMLYKGVAQFCTKPKADYNDPTPDYDGMPFI